MPTENALPADRIDPDVYVPAAVRAAAAKAEELIQANYGNQAQQAQTSEGDAIRIEPEAPAQPAAERFADSQARKQTDAQQPAGDDWEHRYNSMKGRFDRSEQKVLSMSAEISNLHRLIAELQAAPAPAADAEPARTRLITPEEETDYGADFLAVVGKKAKEELLPELTELRNQLASVKGQVSGVSGVVAQDSLGRMYTTLDDALPNWKEINTSPDFLAWLALPDAYSGAIRRDLLSAAYQRHDANRVAAFFKGFISDEAIVNPAITGGPNKSSTPAGNNSGGKTAKVPLEQFAAPGRAKAAAVNPPTEKPILTRSDIQRFYSQVRAGEFIGKDAEKKQIEEMIFDATRDGRIR